MWNINLYIHQIISLYFRLGKLIAKSNSLEPSRLVIIDYGTSLSRTDSYSLMDLS